VQVVVNVVVLGGSGLVGSRVLELWAETVIAPTHADLDVLDDEVRDAMGLVSEKQYRELFERYVGHVLAWTRGERAKTRGADALANKAIDGYKAK